MGGLPVFGDTHCGLRGAVATRGETVKKHMQCKGIPILPILQLMAKNPDRWHIHWDLGDYTLRPAFPPGCSDLLICAKLRQLIRKGLITGYAHPRDRGDFTITAKGLAFIAEQAPPARREREASPAPP